MFGFWFRVLIVLYALWLLRRLIASLAGTGKRKSAPAAGQGRNEATANLTVKDPICGMYMDPRLAMRVDKGKDSFFFCSNECKQKYLSQAR